MSGTDLNELELDLTLCVQERSREGRATFTRPRRSATLPAAPTRCRMTQEQKIIRAKVGLLELAKQLGNVSQACKVMGRGGPPPLATRQLLPL